MNNVPTFSAYEVNTLRARSLKSEYYLNCYDIVLKFLDDKPMSEKQMKWLWGIKADLKEE